MGDWGDDVGRLASSHPRPAGLSPAGSQVQHRLCVAQRPSGPDRTANAHARVQHAQTGRASKRKRVPRGTSPYVLHPLTNETISDRARMLESDSYQGSAFLQWTEGAGLMGLHRHRNQLGVGQRRLSPHHLLGAQLVPRHYGNGFARPTQSPFACVRGVWQIA